MTIVSETRQAPAAGRAAWQLVREYGLEYRPSSSSPPVLPLQHPVVCEPAGDQMRLIVDETGAGNGVPARIECRTMLLDRGGNVCFDSSAMGMHDGYGCLLPGGRIALLRRTQWDVVIVDLQGAPCGHIDLSVVSKKMPRFMSWTGHSLLVTCLDKPHDLDIVELDEAGRLLWYLPPDSRVVGVPGSVQWLPDDTLLVADVYRHVVYGMTRDGKATVRWGERKNPAPDLFHLSGPSCAHQAEDGSLLIADTQNHRVLEIDADGTPRELRIPGRVLVGPSYAAATSQGRVLCDAVNRSVLEVGPGGDVVWQSADGPIAGRGFSFPRSVQWLGADRYLVADTAHNRLVEIDEGAARDLPVSPATPLFWPRSAYRTAAGRTLIADGRRSRVLELADSGAVTRMLTAVRWAGETIELDDPHDVRPAPDGRLLITDSSRNVVVETSWDGDAVWCVGAGGEPPLRDPHSAQRLDDGRVLVCDTNHQRLLIVDPESGAWRVMTEIRDGAAVRRLNRPRYAEVASDGTMVVVDTGNNRVLAATLEGELIWELSAVPGSPLQSLSRPRWAHLLGRDEVVVSDHFHHRILHLKREAGP